MGVLHGLTILHVQRVRAPPMNTHAAPQGNDDRTDLDELYGRPGFLLRRAHQIAVSLFMTEMADHGLTTTAQYGLMHILRARPGIDQIGLSKLIGLDRSTTGLVLGKLERDGFVTRLSGATDRRRKHLHLTAAGESLMCRLSDPVYRAQEKVLAPFSPDERATFLSLLDKFVTAFNDTTRAPLMREPNR
jgi:DNA-binding MarR family transcriptional regulator